MKGCGRGSGRVNAFPDTVICRRMDKEPTLLLNGVTHGQTKVVHPFAAGIAGFDPQPVFCGIEPPARAALGADNFHATVAAVVNIVNPVAGHSVLCGR